MAVAIYMVIAIVQELNFIEAGRVEWREAPAPTLQSPGEVLVRPLAVATCDLDAA